MNYYFCFLFFIVAIKNAFLISSPDSLTYTAAVVEYYPLRGSIYSAEERTNTNVKYYLSFLDEIETQLDIIVYPESTITYGFMRNNRTNLLEHATKVPQVSENLILCNENTTNFSQYLITLSCGALNFRTYLVANILEKHSCSGDNCASDGWDVYNTNVVFDRNGTLVARYRKFNLFGEYSLNKTSEPDMSTFTTDFNVTFGIFTCFDLLFDVPTNALVRNGIQEFVFPTMWFSEIPFLTALQAQKQWAYENDVNLLAAEANNPYVGSGGSGIYEGKKGAKVSTIVALGGSKVLIANVTKKGMSENASSVDEELTVEEIDSESLLLDDFYLITDESITYSISMINTNESAYIEETLCNGEINRTCCNFKLNISVNNSQNNKNYYHYSLVAFNGVRSFSGTYNGGIELCALVSCSNQSTSSCGYRINNYSSISWPITFESIKIEANFSDDSYKQQYPNSVRTNLKPLPTSYFNWSYVKNSNENVITRIYSMDKAENRLLTFGIYGRDYSRDSANESSSGSLPIKNNLFLLTILTFTWSFQVYIFNF